MSNPPIPNPQSPNTLLYATCVSIGGKGVLLLGESGSGKSDLALRLIDGGATLVADDQVAIKALPLDGGGLGGGESHAGNIRKGHPHPNPPPSRGRELLASPAPNIHGMLEVRGIGILRLPYVHAIALALAIKLIPRENVERMPHHPSFDCLGVQLPLLSLHAFDHSTPAKIRMYLANTVVS